MTPRPKPKVIPEAEKIKITAACKDVIQGCLDNNVFTKVVGAESSYPQVFTGIAWGLTTIDQKNNLLQSVGILSVTSSPPKPESSFMDFRIVQVFDGSNGKKIGVWSSYNGYKEKD